MCHALCSRNADKKPIIRHLTTVCTHPEAHLYCNDELIELFVSRDRYMLQIAVF